MLHVLKSIWKSTDVVTEFIVSRLTPFTKHYQVSIFYISWWTQGKRRMIWDSDNCVSKGDQSHGLYKLKKQTKSAVRIGRMETVQFPSKTCRNYYLYLKKWMKSHSSPLMSATFPSLTALPENNMTSRPVAICHLSSHILTAVMDRDDQSSLHPPPSVPRKPDSPSAGLLGQYCLNSKELKAAALEGKTHQYKQHGTVSGLTCCFEDSPVSQIISVKPFFFPPL